MPRVRRDAGHQSLKLSGVVLKSKVDQFMKYDILNQGRLQHNSAPVEMHSTIGRNFPSGGAGHG